MNVTGRTRLSPAARKKQLLDTAKAMIVEEGLQRFTVEALARTAGVTTPLVYNYFSSRQALLKSLLVQEYESYRLKTVAEVGAAKSFDDVVRAYVTSNFDHHAPGSILPILQSQPEIVEIGGLSGLINDPRIADKISFFPDFSDPTVWVPLLLIPLAVQWWAVWYPGAEPGGGGYIAQRMLSAKNEKNAVGATLFFNFAHYALRPWPWIIVALASLIIYPELSDIQAEFPGIDPKYLKDDIAYPAMLTKLGPGWLGLVVASIIAAYMSTIGTHLNWGSSYIVNDFYKRFVKPDASEHQMVRMGRITTVLLMVFAGTLSLTVLDNATEAFNILLLTGAGSGAVYIMRWFWWRINAITEIVTMVVATFVALILVLLVDDQQVATTILDGFTVKLLITVGIVTVSWIVTTLITKPEKKEVLRAFYKLTIPGGPGWKKVVDAAIADGDPCDEGHGVTWQMPKQILLVFIGCITIYTSLFGIGGLVYGNTILGMGLLLLSSICAYLLFRIMSKLNLD